MVNLTVRPGTPPNGQRRGVKLTPAQRIVLAALVVGHYTAGATVPDICVMYRRSDRNIRDMLTAAGVYIPTPRRTDRG